MANSIGYISTYMNLLDSVYKKNSATALLETNPLAVKFSSENAQIVYLKDITVEGLGTYSRSAGYVSGDADVAWTAYTMTQDRGKKFILDALDEKEALTTILEIASVFTREKVVPEIDAYRFEKICTLCGLDVSADLTYDTAISALDTGIAALDDAEVPAEGRVLMVSNAMYALLKQSGEFFNVRIASAVDGNLNREITTFDGMPLVRVPTGRFCNNFDFSATNGFTKTTGSKNLNFVIADKNAVAAITKYVNPKIVAPENNIDADAYVFGFRIYHDLFIPTNKLPGVYIHAKSTTN
jgi:hypothetical protein